jgi:hypothetical protein
VNLDADSLLHGLEVLAVFITSLGDPNRIALFYDDRAIPEVDITSNAAVPLSQGVFVRYAMSAVFAQIDCHFLSFF